MASFHEKMAVDMSLEDAPYVPSLSSKIMAPMNIFRKPSHDTIITTDERVEKLLSEKLLEGYLLLEKPCPNCATPLVKLEAADPEHGTKVTDNNEKEEGDIKKAPAPVMGVPFCVNCTAHIITRQNELSLLDERELARGSIWVALVSPKKSHDETEAEPTTLDSGVDNEDKIVLADVAPDKSRSKKSPLQGPFHSLFCRGEPEDVAASPLASPPAPEPPGMAAMMANASSIMVPPLTPVHTIEPAHVETYEIAASTLTPSYVTSYSSFPQATPVPDAAVATQQTDASKVDHPRSTKSQSLVASKSPTKKSTSLSPTKRSKPSTRTSRTPSLLMAAQARATNVVPLLSSGSKNGSVGICVETASASQWGTSTTPLTAAKNFPRSKSRPTAIQVQEDGSDQFEVRLRGQSVDNVDLSDNENSAPASSTTLIELLDVATSTTPTGSAALKEAEKVNDMPSMTEIGHDEEVERVLSHLESMSMADDDDDDQPSLDTYWPKYTERREMATKVLGRKMLQGFELLEFQCSRCKMPLMSLAGCDECVVCPVLEAHAIEARKRAQGKKLTQDVESLKQKLSLKLEKKRQNEQKEQLEHDLRQQRETIQSKKAERLNKLRTPKLSAKTPTMPDEMSKASTKHSASVIMSPSEREVAYQTSLLESTSEQSSAAQPRAKVVITSDEVGDHESKLESSATNDFTAIATGGNTVGGTSTVEATAGTMLTQQMKLAVQTGMDMDQFQLHQERHAAVVHSTSMQGSSVQSAIEAPVTTNATRANESERAPKQHSTVASVPPSQSSLRSKHSNTSNSVIKKTTIDATAPTSTNDSQLSFKQNGNHESTEAHPVPTKSGKSFAENVPAIKEQDSVSVHRVLASEPSFQHYTQTCFGLPWLNMHADQLLPPTASQSKALDEEEERLLEEVRKAEQAHNKSKDAENKLQAAEKALKDQASILADAIEKETARIVAETKRLEELECRRKESEQLRVDGMMADLNSQQHREMLEEESKLRREISAAKASRDEAELEARRLKDEKRANEEAKMLEGLESVAASRQKEADEALARAKEAMEQVSVARRQILTKTIQEGDADALAEVESLMRAEAEDYHEGIKLPTADDLQRERWETLRTEGRAVLTRRLIQGWTLLPELCRGKECHNSPLIVKSGDKLCVVCGGTGNGRDGVYGKLDDEDVGSDDESAAVGDEDFPDGDGIFRPPSVVRATLEGDESEGVGAHSPTQRKSVKELQDEFESKRNTVSKEIGKRMMKGWTLLDQSCPKCVMPLMTDKRAKYEICVLCGKVGTIGPASPGKKAQLRTISKPNAPKDANTFEDDRITKELAVEMALQTYVVKEEEQTSTSNDVNGDSKQTPAAASPNEMSQSAEERTPMETTSNAEQSDSQPKNGEGPETIKYEVDTRGDEAGSSEALSGLAASVAKSSAHPKQQSVQAPAAASPYQKPQSADERTPMETKPNAEQSDSQLKNAEGPETIKYEVGIRGDEAGSSEALSGLAASIAKSSARSKQQSVQDPSPVARSTGFSLGGSRRTNGTGRSCDPPAVQGYTLRRRNAVDVEGSTGEDLHLKISNGVPALSVDTSLASASGVDASPSAKSKRSWQDASPKQKSWLEPSPRATASSSCKSSDDRDDSENDSVLELDDERDDEHTQAVSVIIDAVDAPSKGNTSHVVMIQIPKDFNANDEASVRKLIEEATNRSRIEIDTSSEMCDRKVAHLPSPGMTKASLPHMIASPGGVSMGRNLPGVRQASSNASSTASRSQSTRRPRMIPESLHARTRRTQRRADPELISTAINFFGKHQMSPDTIVKKSGSVVSGVDTRIESPANATKSDTKTRSTQSDLVLYGGLFEAELGGDADSITSDAIDALLSRIDETKKELEQAISVDSIEAQIKLSLLLDNLAEAAADMQRYDGLDDNDNWCL